jgi:hypothetical protein
MMPPPITSMRFGTKRSSSAPVESTMRGSRGMKGRWKAAEPAAMMHFSKRTTFFAPVFSCDVAGGQFDFEVVGVEEVAVAAHDLDLARLGHAGQAAGQLADHLFLVRAQLVEVDRLGAAKLTPSSACAASSITAATCSSAFDGMQPTLRQTPPSVA